MSRDEGIIQLLGFSMFGAVIGVTTFCKGFKNLKLKRLIENIPTSKIRSMPMGLVEVVGEALKTFEMQAPFSALPCVYFKYLVEEYRSSGKSGHWVTVKQGSSPLPFLIKDDTDTITVNPLGAEIDLHTVNSFSNSFFNSMPQTAKTFLDKNGISITSWLGFSKKMRLTEYIIPPGKLVYVIGVSKHSGENLEKDPKYSEKLQKKQQIVMDTLKKLKKSSLLFEKYDLNKDGKIDDSEWESARQDVSKWVDYNMSKENKEDQVQHESIKVEIGKGNEGQSFFIADKSQKDLLGEMFWKSSGFIIGGAVLTLICCGVILAIL